MNVGAVENMGVSRSLVLSVDETLKFTKDLYDGKTTIVFGRNPETLDPKYQHFDNEVGVKLSVEDVFAARMIPRRAMAIRLLPDGGINLINPSGLDMEWKLGEQKNKIMKPQAEVYLAPGTDLRNLTVDLARVVSLKAQAVGSMEGTNKKGLLSVKLTTVLSERLQKKI